MIERKVTKVLKNNQGKIIALCNYFEYWSPRIIENVITDIETGLYDYYVEKDSQRISLHIQKEEGKQYLMASFDPTLMNLLGDLPYFYL